MNEQEMAINNCIYKIRVGSHLYGTNTEKSDEDYSGIFIATEKYYFGLYEVEEVDLSYESKNENGKNNSDAKDFKLYEIRKFFNLALQNNPNIIEQLFADNKNILFKDNIFDSVLENKNKFLSKRLFNRFLGYAISQRNKMQIKTENYSDLIKAYDILNKYDNKLVIIEIPFFKEKDKSGNIRIGDITLPNNLFVKRAKQCLGEKLKRIGNRRELVEKFGYDTKFASHLIRLLHEGIELLTTENLEFPLKQKDTILQIKNGEWSLEKVLDESDRLTVNIQEFYDKTKLPNSPDINYFSDMVSDIIYKTLIF